MGININDGKSEEKKTVSLQIKTNFDTFFAEESVKLSGKTFQNFEVNFCTEISFESKQNNLKYVA